MGSDPKTVAFIVDQASSAGDVRAKPMFGEYGLYCDGKMVALVCDDRLFVKPTSAGRAVAKSEEEGQPYPGAKPHLVVSPEHWDNGTWLGELFRLSAAELPPPKPRKGRRSSQDE